MRIRGTISVKKVSSKSSNNTASAIPIKEIRRKKQIIRSIIGGNTSPIAPIELPILAINYFTFNSSIRFDTSSTNLGQNNWSVAGFTDGGWVVVYGNNLTGDYFGKKFVLFKGSTAAESLSLEANFSNTSDSRGYYAASVRAGQPQFRTNWIQYKRNDIWCLYDAENDIMYYNNSTQNEAVPTRNWYRADLQNPTSIELQIRLFRENIDNNNSESGSGSGSGSGTLAVGMGSLNNAIDATRRVAVSYNNDAGLGSLLEMIYGDYTRNANKRAIDIGHLFVTRNNFVVAINSKPRSLGGGIGYAGAISFYKDSNGTIPAAAISYSLEQASLFANISVASITNNYGPGADYDIYLVKNEQQIITSRGIPINRNPLKILNDNTSTETSAFFEVFSNGKVFRSKIANADDYQWHYDNSNIDITHETRRVLYAENVHNGLFFAEGPIACYVENINNLPVINVIDPSGVSLKKITMPADLLIYITINNIKKIIIKNLDGGIYDIAVSIAQEEGQPNLFYGRLDLNSNGEQQTIAFTSYSVTAANDITYNFSANNIYAVTKNYQVFAVRVNIGQEQVASNVRLIANSIGIKYIPSEGSSGSGSGSGSGSYGISIGESLLDEFLLGPLFGPLEITNSTKSVQTVNEYVILYVNGGHSGPILLINKTLEKYIIDPQFNSIQSAGENVYTKQIDYNSYNLPISGWVNAQNNPVEFSLTTTPVEEWIVIFGTANGWYNNAYWINNVKTTLTQNGTGTVNDYGVLVENNGITITSYFGNETQLTIPSEILGLPVKTIRENAFKDKMNITSITIPNSVTTIESYAFRGCQNLISIVLPNSITSIGNGAFEYCYDLTNITIPNSVTSIGNAAFARCTSLTTINIPNSVTSIGDIAFYDCSGLTSVTIPNSVTTIGNGAFYGCTGLTSITIPNSVTSIGDIAFLSAGLTSVVLPQIFSTELNRLGLTQPNLSVYHIGTDNVIRLNQNGTLVNALSNYTSTLENGGVTLSAYTGNETSVNIPNQVAGLPVKNIGDSAFYNKLNMTSVTIPNSVISIGNQAFLFCRYLTSVTIPNSVTSIGYHAFNGCIRLTSVTIPNSVTSIGIGAFYDTALTTITIPNSVTSIESLTFFSCDGLTSITIPNSVTSIGSQAFQNCSSLTSVAIPNSVTSIGDYAFENCSGLTTITIPNSVTSIGNNAFYGCTGLTSITIPNSVTSIGSGVFYGCTSLTTVTIPNSVTSIGTSAFSNCSGLTSVTIPNSVTSIGTSAFQDCISLTSVTIPNSVTSIGISAFFGCTGLTSIIIPDSVTTIGDSAFQSCTSLTSITLPQAFSTELSRIGINPNINITYT